MKGGEVSRWRVCHQRGYPVYFFDVLIISPLPDLPDLPAQVEVVAREAGETRALQETVRLQVRHSLQEMGNIILYLSPGAGEEAAPEEGEKPQGAAGAWGGQGGG